METKNAKIDSTLLGFEGHGIFTCFLYLDYSGSSQGFGGYVIKGDYSPLEGILKVVGVESWEKLKGEYVRVEIENGRIQRIGNILEDKWFKF